MYNTYSNFQGNPSKLKTDNKTFSIWLYIIKDSYGWNNFDCSISLTCSWKLNIIIEKIVSEGNQMRAFWWIPKQIFIPSFQKMKMYAMSTEQKKSCSITSPQFIQKHLFVFFFLFSLKLFAKAFWFTDVLWSWQDILLMMVYRNRILKICKFW